MSGYPPVAGISVGGAGTTEAGGARVGHVHHNMIMMIINTITNNVLLFIGIFRVKKSNDGK